MRDFEPRHSHVTTSLHFVRRLRKFIFSGCASYNELPDLIRFVCLLELTSLGLQELVGEMAATTREAAMKAVEAIFERYVWRALIFYCHVIL